jgi:hypothetical protein
MVTRPTADEVASCGGNGTGESKLRAGQIGLQARMGALERSGRIAKVSGNREGSQDFEGAAHVPTVKIDIASRGRGGTTGDDAGALWSLRVGDGCTHERVTAKKLDALSMGRYWAKESNENENGQQGEYAHNDMLLGKF